MTDILRAFGRSLRSLTQRGVLWHLIWPTVVAMAVWLGIGLALWSPVVTGLMGWIVGLPWLGDWLSSSELGAAAVLVLVQILLALLLVPLIYVTAALLVAAIGLPLMLERVGRRDYPDLEQRRGGSNLGSVWNAGKAGLLFLLGFLLTLPFWLIPGVGLVLSLLLTARLNQRAFSYDALMLHADREELARLPKSLRSATFGVGIGSALLAYIPVVNLFAPAFCGLAFAHFLLDALRRDRAERGWAIVPAGMA
jgi:CysZ protein